MTGTANNILTGPAATAHSVSGQRSAVSGQRSAVSGQRSAVSGQRSAVSGQRSGSKPTLHFPSFGAPMLISGAPSRDGIADNGSVAAIGSAAYRNTPSIAASCTRPASNSRSVSGRYRSVINCFAAPCDRVVRVCKDGFIRRDKPKGCAGPDGCAGTAFCLGGCPGAPIVFPEHHDVSRFGASLITRRRRLFTRALCGTIFPLEFVGTPNWRKPA